MTAWRHGCNEVGHLSVTTGRWWRERNIGEPCIVRTCIGGARHVCWRCGSIVRSDRSHDDGSWQVAWNVYPLIGGFGNVKGKSCTGSGTLGGV